jgi:histidyl-tRNA synthetase
MSFQAVKGTRDFYPDAMRLRNWITDAWRRVSLRNGFEEYDSPIFEYLDLFTAKSGPEIAEQLFSFTDRGGRNLAIRPEMTPSLARMVNAKINSLPRPVKWFSIGRACRAENPQKGRLREFFQWNIDIIGEDSPLADAECVFVAVDAMRELGLTAGEVEIRYSSRALTGEVLAGFGTRTEDIQDVLAVLDKRNKVPNEAFEEMLAKVIPAGLARAGVLRFLDMREAGLATMADSIAKNVGLRVTQEMISAQAALEQFQKALKDFGVSDWCRYDTNVVRGLAYYTGVVYEIYDRGQSLRAVAGGGRYDNLLEALGGPKVGGTGFGMGDVVLGILLEEKGKLAADLRSQRLDFFVVDGQEGQLGNVLEAVAKLRGQGLSADFTYKRQPIGKQLKEANRRGAARAAIVKKDTVTVKDLASGNQQDRPLADFLARPVI